MSHPKFRMAGALSASLIALTLVSPPSVVGAKTVDQGQVFSKPADPVAIAMKYLEQSPAQLGVTAADLTDLVVSSVYRSSHNGVTHVNVNQRYQGREVFGAYATVNIADGEVLFVGDSLVKGLSARGAAAPDVDALAAVGAAADELDLDDPTALRVIDAPSGRAQETVLSRAGISSSPIPARLGWHSAKSGALRLAWQLVIDATEESHLWNATVDATSGELLEVDDWTASHSRQELATTLSRRPAPASAPSAWAPPHPIGDGSRYRVFKHPNESPNDGGRTFAKNPADATGSPFGWHDTDGAAGPEHTTTQGNNVHAYTDRDANNIADPNSSPDGGRRLNFDFPVNLNEHPSTYTDAATTNLFYWNNVMHDVTYRYGFDEAAGNFQANNYRRGGAGGDQVRAEAIDGSGDSNANFETPLEDGTGVPRMQMYLWSGQQFGLPNQVTVNSGTASGTYAAQYAMFTPAPRTATPQRGMVLVNDALGNPSDGCQPHSVPAGAIAVVDRPTAGACTFYAQVVNAESAGASAVVVVNNSPAQPPVMTGSVDPAVGIPAVMVSQANGNVIKSGLPATGSVHRDPNHPQARDGDLDAGIVLHEYGHGVSLRLTGGPNVNCLTGEEQMGEGWSDFFAMAMLMDTKSDNPEKARGMATYSSFGNGRRDAGIRPRPYSRNMAIQPATYDSIKTQGWLNGATLSNPHGTGHVWAAVLWDMTWDLVEKHGFNPNIYKPWNTGGNNLAIQLVMDGLKFQGCDPGFVAGRDAIIAADEALTGGENTCTLWAAFARRGLGFSAIQGTTARNDNFESFDTHPDCQQGFLGNVSSPPDLNNIKNPGGPPVPIEFTLGGNRGLDILASNSPYTRQVDCATRRTLDPTSSFITPRPIPVPTVSPGHHKLRYDRHKDKYTYDWKTDQAWSGTCREFVLTRKDGVQHRAYFSFGTVPPVEPPAEKWVARYNGGGNGTDLAEVVRVSPNGTRVFVTGRSLGSGGNNDYATVAYDAFTGEQLWSARYNGPSNGIDFSLSLAVSPDGSRVFATGGSQGQGTSFDYATVAYDAATGEQQWVARHDGPVSGSDSAQAIEVSQDGSRVVVTGSGPGVGSSNDYSTVAYNAATGEQLWAARYDGPGSGPDFAQALVVSPDASRVLITGHSPGVSGQFDYATVAYDAGTGQQQWVARHNGPTNGADFATALGVTADGSRVIVTGEDFGGSAASGGTVSDYATVAYDASTGEEIWVARRNGPGNGGDAAEALAMSPDGSQVVVTGQSQGADTAGPDFATIAYDTSDGSQQWVSTYNPVNGFDVAWGVGVSPDGSRVFVTGQSTGAGTGLDYATVTYDSSDGSQLKTARLNGPANGTDVAQALAVSADGSAVFVAGYSLGLGTDLDFATAAYRTSQ